MWVSGLSEFFGFFFYVRCCRLFLSICFGEISVWVIGRIYESKDIKEVRDIFWIGYCLFFGCYGVGDVG